MPHPTRSASLRMSAGWRFAVTAGAAFLAAGLAWNLAAWSRGELEWTTTQKVLIPALAVVVLLGLIGVVGLWTNKVWVDYERNELHHASVYGDAVISLDAPTTVKIDYTPPAPGSTVFGKWRVRIRPEHGPAVTISTPAVPSISSLLAILHPALERNPDLPADDYTRRALEQPSAPLLPPQLDGRG